MQDPPQVLLRLCIARQDQVMSIGGRQMHVEHLHRLELFEDRPRRQAGALTLARCLSVI